MQEFIASVAQNLGIDESVAKRATAKVLEFLKEKIGEGDFANLLSGLPGADALVQGSSSSGDSGGGMLGGLAKMASSAIGGSAGEGIELAGSLSDAGVTADQIPAFLSQLVQFVKEHVGEDAIAQLADKVPALKGVLGD